MSAPGGNLEDTFLTVAEVADMLKLNQQTVRNWIDQGSLPALRVGRRVRIRSSDLERLLDEGSTLAPGSAVGEAGPSAQDFWGGEPIGVAEPPQTPDGRPGTSSDQPTVTDNGLTSDDE
jgi:excisionase family DNA binding protein